MTFQKIEFYPGKNIHFKKDGNLVRGIIKKVTSDPVRECYVYHVVEFDTDNRKLQEVTPECIKESMYFKED